MKQVEEEESGNRQKEENLIHSSEQMHVCGNWNNILFS